MICSKVAVVRVGVQEDEEAAPKWKLLARFPNVGMSAPQLQSARQETKEENLLPWNPKLEHNTEAHCVTVH
eukprot:3242325-Amphidinium_carterae.1